MPDEPQKSSAESQPEPAEPVSESDRPGAESGGAQTEEEPEAQCSIAKAKKSIIAAVLTIALVLLLTVAVTVILRSIGLGRHEATRDYSVNDSAQKLWSETLEKEARPRPLGVPENISGSVGLKTDSSPSAK